MVFLKIFCIHFKHSALSPQSDKCCKSDRENYAKSSPFLQTPHLCCLPKIPGFELWKYVDDSTIVALVVKKFGSIERDDKFPRIH